MIDACGYVSNDIGRTISATALAIAAVASAGVSNNLSGYLQKKYVDCSYGSSYPTRTLIDIEFVMSDSYIPHEIKEFIARIGLSESDVNGIVSIIKKSFVNPSISYDIEVDGDEELLSVTVFDASYDDDERDCHIDSFYSTVNFDGRWHDFFSKSVIYFK